MKFFVLLLLVTLALSLPARKPTVKVEVEAEGVDLGEGVQVIVDVSSSGGKHHEEFSSAPSFTKKGGHFILQNQGDAFGPHVFAPLVGMNPACKNLVCTANITKAAIGTGGPCTTAAKTSLKQDGCEIGCGFDCGHILANDLGGSGDLDNAFCQSSSSNVGAWKTMEQSIKTCLQNTKAAITANLKWTFGVNFEFPTTVKYEVAFTGGVANCTVPLPITIQADTCTPAVTATLAEETIEPSKAEEPSVQQVDPIYPRCSGKVCTVTGLKGINLDEGTPCSTKVKNDLKDDGCLIGCGFDCGHILANSLGGDGSVANNVFCQASSNNVGIWKQFETYIYDCLALAPGTATANLTWTFDTTNRTFPSTVKYEVSFSSTANCTNQWQPNKVDVCVPAV